MPDPLLIAGTATSSSLLLPGARQPPRPHHRRHRHRQDRDAAGDRGAAVSAIGVPVFMADVKGDLAGMSQPGATSPKLARAAEADRRRRRPRSPGCPVVFWDVFGEQGHPVRATVSDLGPLLLSRILNLNDTQEGVLTLVFKIADDNGLLLLDLKDLRALLQYVGDNAQSIPDELRQRLGGVDRRDPARPARARAAGRRQVPRRADAERRRPAADRRRPRRRQHPRRRPADAVAAAVRDAAAVAAVRALRAAARGRRPRQAEARVLLRRGAPAVHRRAEGAAGQDRAGGAPRSAPRASACSSSRRIRSTCPDIVLGQLGNRVQHALRAFTPRDQKAVKAAATTMRANPKLDTEKAITELGVGEALISFLDEKGRPGIVERAFVLPPASRIGPITPEERKAVHGARRRSRASTTRRSTANRPTRSLKGRAATSAGGARPRAAAPAGGGDLMDSIKGSLGGLMTGSGRKDSLVEAMAKSAARTSARPSAARSCAACWARCWAAAGADPTGRRDRDRVRVTGASQERL